MNAQPGAAGKARSKMRNLRWHYAALAVVIALFAGTARAGEYDLLEEVRITCDTEIQVKKFAALGMKDEDVDIINAAEPEACNMVEIRFAKGPAIDEVRVKGAMLDVVEIVVVAFKYKGKWREFNHPLLQYTLIPIERGA